MYLNTYIVVRSQVIEEMLKKVNTFFYEEWANYEDAVEAAQVTHFKDYKPLKVK